MPLFAVVIIYIATDVFKVIRHYDPYYTESDYVGVNRAYGSAMTYLNQNPEYHYDSFIFGNSRSLFYEVDTWKKHLPAGSSCMHFDESGGSIKGIAEKVRFIDENGGRLNNALLVVDHELLSVLEQKDGYLFITPPILKDNAGIVDFHVQHFVAFLNLKFLTALVDYGLFGKFRPYMKNLIIEGRPAYIAQYNEYRETKREEEIARGVYYDKARMRVFEGVQKPRTFSTEKLGTVEMACLYDIKRIFDRHNTDYRVIVSPLYDQVKLNTDTYGRLCEVFGKDCVYDFSGVNKWNRDYHNYYEKSHYRPVVAAEIMDIVYSRAHGRAHEQGQTR